MNIKIFGGVLLAAGIVSLIISVFALISIESDMSIVLLALSILANVAGISILRLAPSQKK